MDSSSLKMSSMSRSLFSVNTIDFLHNLNATALGLNVTQRKLFSGVHDYDLQVLHDSQRYGVAVTSTLLLMLSLISNTAAFLAHFKRKIRPLFRTCLISLSASDIITTIFLYIAYMSQTTSEYPAIWTVGDILCSLIPFATTGAVLVNSLTLVGIATDRYLAIVKFVKGTWNPGPVLCTSWAILLWGFSAGISSPNLASFYVVEFYVIETDPRNRSHILNLQLASTCFCDNESNWYYNMLVFTVIFLPFLIAFVWLFMIIAKEIWCRRHETKQSTALSMSVTAKDKLERNCKPNIEINALQKLENNSDDRSNNEHPNSKMSTNTSLAEWSSQSIREAHRNDFDERKARGRHEIRQLRMFIAIIVLMTTFLACRLPMWLFVLYKNRHKTTSNLLWMLHFCFGLISMANCVVNPLLYTFLTETIQLSLNFIDRLRQQLRNCFHRNK